MLIRQVRFKNLNSLVGEWFIDFTDPVIASEAIVAITGPTGAGKSTILDAISLALYGRTPRLSNINQSGNEIMSRRTSECFSEVSFATPAGGYRCHWSQRRARNRADGRLQAQKHELADAGSGQILASKVNDVAVQVSAITGMDFDRFTRTMFLAQGNFAAFLLARPDERAPILEQITGTKIYSDISKQVHELCVAEHKKLDDLRVRLGAFELLSPNEEEVLRQELEQKRESASLLGTALLARNEEVEWLRRLASLEEGLRQLGLQRQSWKPRNEAFEPQRQKLRRAGQALELAGAYSELVALRREQMAETQSNISCQEQLELARLRSEKILAEQRNAAELFEKNKACLQSMLPLLRQVRDLDLKIQEKTAPLEIAGQEVAQAEAGAMLGRKQLEQAGKEKQRLQQKLEIVSGLLSKSMADEGLERQLPLLRASSDLILSTHKDLAARIAEKESLVGGLAESAKRLDHQKSVLAVSAQKVELVRQELEQAEKELEGALAGSSLEEWSRVLRKLTEGRVLLEKSAEVLAALKSSEETVALLKKQQGLDLAGLAEAEKLLPEKEMNLLQMERSRDLLEKQLVLLKKINSFEQERALLVPGSPCPVCGALDHPFAQGEVPLEDDTGSELSEFRASLKRQEQHVSELKLRRRLLQNNVHLAGERQKEEEIKLVSRHNMLKELCAKLSLDAGLDGLPARIHEKLEQVGREASRTEARIECLHKLQARLEKLRKKQTEASGEFLAAEKGHTTIEATYKADLESLNRIQKEEESLRAVQAERLKDLEDQLLPFTLLEPNVENLKKQMENLAGRLEIWQARSAERSRLERETATLVLKVEQCETLLRKEETDLALRQERYGFLLAERNALAGERAALFGGRLVDEEELRATRAAADSGKALEAVQKQYEHALREIYGLEQKARALVVSLENRQQTITRRQTDFEERFRAKGFVNEDDYLTACLPEEERLVLSRQAQKLADEDKALATQEAQTARALETEREKKVSEETLSSVAKIVADLQDKQGLLQQEIGGILRKLQDNDDADFKRKQYLQEVEIQKKICGRWDTLHELIGSSDGKKYRNFAQGLTFEMLIAHANSQLRNMSDRYLLLPSADSPLELSVIDNYQAGEVRTAKNLSGGECFIVSLALALGLSRMASKNVRVDSLFLDEGFGSLDEESLDVALESLGNLKKEGKLIVLISHVQALRERVGARIRVTPAFGGRSSISGPGCRQGTRADYL